MLRPTVACVVWSSAISVPCVFAAVVCVLRGPWGRGSRLLRSSFSKTKPSQPHWMDGRRRRAWRDSGSESWKANTGTTDMAGSLRVVIALSLQRLCEVPGCEWRAGAGCGRGSLIIDQPKRPDARRRSGASTLIREGSVGFSWPHSTHALCAHSTPAAHDPLPHAPRRQWLWTPYALLK